MKPRSHARQAAFQILYQLDMQGPPFPEGAKLASLLQENFDYFNVGEKAREFASQLVTGSLNHRQRIDELIELSAQNWKVARMNYVDRNLLRLSTYEMSHFDDIPPSITIDEAVEIAKNFGTRDTPSFINGILDAVAHQVRAS